MKSVFVDTHYFIALASPSDPAHDAACQEREQPGRSLITTTWVLAEFGNAMARGSTRAVFLETLDRLAAGKNAVILNPSRIDIDAAVELYRARPDKDWSLTDCVSFVIMRKRRIREALTGDHHFTQAGFRALLNS